MSFWTDWSDGKKWFMTIIVPTLITGVGFVAGRIELTIEAARKADCTRMLNYPRGTWNIGYVQVWKGPPNTSFAPAIEFESASGGIWPEGLGKQNSQGFYPAVAIAPFTISRPLSPGASLTITFDRKNPFSDAEEKAATAVDRQYHVDTNAIVSADGCSITAHTKQQATGGNIVANAIYCWEHAPSCPQPASSSWREPGPKAKQPGSN